MFRFQTVPKSEQNGWDFRQCLKTKPFGNGTLFRVFEIRTFQTLTIFLTRSMQTTISTPSSPRTVATLWSTLRFPFIKRLKHRQFIKPQKHRQLTLRQNLCRQKMTTSLQERSMRKKSCKIWPQWPLNLKVNNMPVPRAGREGQPPRAKILRPAK